MPPLVLTHVHAGSPFVSVFYNPNLWVVILAGSMPWLFSGSDSAGHTVWEGVSFSFVSTSASCEHHTLGYERHLASPCHTHGPAMLQKECWLTLTWIKDSVKFYPLALFSPLHFCHWKRAAITVAPKAFWVLLEGCVCPRSSYTQT